LYVTFLLLEPQIVRHAKIVKNIELNSHTSIIPSEQSQALNSGFTAGFPSASQTGVLPAIQQQISDVRAVIDLNNKLIWCQPIKCHKCWKKVLISF